MKYQELSKETKAKINNFNPKNITTFDSEVEKLLLTSLTTEVKEALKEFNQYFMGEDRIADMNFIYQVEEMKLTLYKSLGFKNNSKEWKDFVYMLEENGTKYFRIIFN